MSRRLLLLLLKPRINRIRGSALNVAHFHRVPQLVVQLLRLQQLPVLLLVRLGELLVLLARAVILRCQGADPALQRLNLRVGLVDRLLHPAVERRVLFRQRLVEVLLVVDVLRRLVRPEAERAPGALHDDAGREPAEYARLVRLGRLQVRNHGVVGAAELRLAGWARDAILLPILSRETEAIRAVEAENVAALIWISRVGAQQNKMHRAYLHVVTRARSFSSALHFKLLQVSGRSIISIVQCISVSDCGSGCGWLLTLTACLLVRQSTFSAASRNRTFTPASSQPQGLNAACHHEISSLRQIVHGSF